jgi:hypothetical protein
MAAKTFFYLVVSCVLFLSCADSEDTVEGGEAETNSTSSAVSFNFSGLENLVIGTSGANLNDLGDSKILTYNNSGDLVTVDSIIGASIYPVSFLKINTGDFKAIKYSDNEVYLVSGDGIGTSLSQFGLPSKNFGTKNKPDIYNKLGKFYYLSGTKIINISLDGKGAGIKTVIASNVSGFDVQENFIYYKGLNHFILKNNGELKNLDSESDFNAEFSNFVFRSKNNCIIAKTSNLSLKEYQELCIDKDGVEVVRDARSGYNECRNDAALPKWCQGAVQEFGVNNSLSSCREIRIGKGFLVCQNETHPIFYELENLERRQIELINLNSTGLTITNLVFDFDEKYLYMISGNTGSLIFTKIDIVSKSFSFIPFSYEKPNWINYCKGKLVISVDSKIVNYLKDGSLIEIGSNAGIEEFECIE